MYIYMYNINTVAISKLVKYEFYIPPPLIWYGIEMLCLYCD